MRPAAECAAGNRVLVTGVEQPEGPVVLPNGDILLVEMGEERACVTRVGPTADRSVFARLAGGRPTGLALDGDGCIWVAGGAGGTLVRLSPEGEVLLAIGGDDEGPFLFPNDLAFGPDGLLYMTDSGIAPDDLIRGGVIRADFVDAEYDGRVFQIDPRKGEVLARLATGLRFANGIAFGTDGAVYYNETLTGTIHRHEIGRAPEPYARLERLGSPERFCGPDGMAFDASGRLYCAVYGEQRVALLDPAGRALPDIRTNGDRPTNVAFVPGTAELLVTEVEYDAVEVVSALEVGLELQRPLVGP
jgi:gluconolactonase